jgi:hypothetical protein
MNITVADPADGQGKVLLLAFQPEFQALEVADQGARFREYLGGLAQEIAAIRDENDRNRAGMLIIQQIGEELLPHIEAGELALEESIIIQIRQEQQAVALTDLLRQGS